mgnify:FL=1
MKSAEARAQLAEVGAGLVDLTDFRQFSENRVRAKGFDFDQLADWAIAQGGHVQMDEVNPPRLPGKMVDRPGQEYRCLYVPESAFQDES